MRYLSVSSLGAFSVSAGAPGELHGFTAQLLLESTRASLFARSIVFRGATVVILRVGALDDANDAADAGAALFVTIGSDDGFAEETLRRLAALIAELCLFLNIDALRGGPNAAVLRQVLLYMEARLAACDISILCEIAERVASPGIVATGFAGNATQLLDELAREAFLSQPTENNNNNNNSSSSSSGVRRVPNYVSVLLGHKIVLQTTAHWADVSASASGTGRVALNASDRYLSYIVACAFFAVPRQRGVHDVSPREKKICALELRLRRFGVDRNNCAQKAVKRVIQIYADAMRTDARCGGDETLVLRAAYYEESLRALISLVSLSRGETETAVDDSTDDVLSSNLYHSPDMNCAALSDKTFHIHGICLRNATYVATLHLRFVPFPCCAGLLSACPRGYSLCFVSAPPRTARDYARWEIAADAATDAALARLAANVLGAMETQFNCFQWLLSPPVESYEIPGLLHFAFVDRRRGDGVVASFQQMAQQRSPKEKAAVAALRRLVAVNISRAQALAQRGYSEGLWGHCGLQFFFCVCAVDAALDATGAKKTATGNVKGNAAVIAAAAQILPRASGEGTHGQQAQPESSEEFAFGSRKIPTAVLPHLTLRPMLVPDIMYSDPEDLRVIEVYAVFIGTMSPAGVSNEVKKLIRRQLLSPG